MKDFLVLAALGPCIHVAQTSALDPSTFPLWERLLEKWGIGFIGLAMFGVLAFWTYKREEKAQEKRDKREDEANAERIALAKENNQLSKDMLTQAVAHAHSLENLIRDNLNSHRELRLDLAELNKAIRQMRQ